MKDFKALCMELFEVVGMSNLLGTILNSMSESIAAELGTEHNSEQEEIIRITVEEHMPEFYDAIIPVYARHLDLADIEEILAFYRSDLGKKLAEKMSVITKEQIEVLDPVGRRIGFDVRTKLQNLVSVDAEKTFTLFWLDGKREVLKGKDPADAFSKRGYGNGALKALDFYRDGDNNGYVWNPNAHGWDKKLGLN